jgi:hypothetical protein
MYKDNVEKSKGILIVGIVFSLMAVGIAIYSYFIRRDSQSIYWFIAAGIAAMTPFVLPRLQKMEIKGVASFEAKTDRASAIAVSAIHDIDQYLSGRLNLTPNEIDDRLEALNQRHLDLVYQYLEGWRQQQVFRIINIKRDESIRKKMREELSLLVPLFKSLILIANGQDYDRHLHYYYSRLAFVYKDMEPQQWEKAHENINYAIESRKEIGNLSFSLYEFNRLICSINKKRLTVVEEKQMHKDFEVVYNDLSARWMLGEGNTSELIAPGLENWLKKNHYREKINLVQS